MHATRAPGKLLLLAAGTVVGVLAAEVIVRVAFDAPARGNITPVPAEIRQEASFPGVPYVLRPGARVVHRFPDDPRGYFDPGATLTYRVNSLGFRGPETTRTKPAGVFRIVGIGDSFTFGTGVREEHTFLRVAQNRLNQRGGGPEFRALNLGVMGYDTAHEVALLQFVGVDLDPDVVVICFFLNDAGGGATHRMFNVDPADDGSSPLRRHSALVDRIASFLERRRQAAQFVEAHQASFAPDSAGWQEARRALEHAVRIAERNGFDLVLTIFPVLWRLSDGHPFEEIHAAVAACAAELGIPVLDLLPAFRGFDGPELWVHPTNQHPNERAHAVAGEALARFLLERLPAR